MPMDPEDLSKTALEWHEIAPGAFIMFLVLAIAAAALYGALLVRRDERQAQRRAFHDE